MVAHGSWAETMMLAGGAQLGLAAGKLKSPLWNLTLGISLFVGGVAILVHEQNGWLYSRAAFGHHLIGWIAIVGALIPVTLSIRPRSIAAGLCFAVLLVSISTVLFADRDTAPIFGHLSPEAGNPHR
jgi:peptidoglycan/LPS O-acetylase OafA/YrhL